MRMNLYSNKQRWKIILLVIAILMIGISLFISNSVVSEVAKREKQKAQQWGDAIKKKIELVQLTNNTFNQLRDNEREKISLWIEATKVVSKATPLNRIPDYSFPLQIINGNKTIPVILLDDHGNVSGNINLGFDTSAIRAEFPQNTKKEIAQKFEDSLKGLAKIWEQKNPSFTVEIYKGLFMTYYYNDSKEIVDLENERDSLIQAFNADLIDKKGSVPVLLIDTKTKEIFGSNIDKIPSEPEEFTSFLDNLKQLNTPIKIDFKNGKINTLYFGASTELKQLQYYPYIQFSVISLFVLIAYLIFSTFRKAEQNQVWAGMAKETAHQLGTPLSSLMAWTQLLESQGTDKMITDEMHKDIDRLERVTNRFSKIGSGGNLEIIDLSETITRVTGYMKPRISDKVNFSVDAGNDIPVLHNPDLIEWVIENICNNAVDAMEGVGELSIKVHKSMSNVFIDITDTGKGIPVNAQKTIFQPGYSTKKRGWGLGLSLVKRIIHQYHKGTVIVFHSELDKGTTFRISLPLNVL